MLSTENTIYNMDCMEGMKLLPDNSIDLVLTDPPYSSGGLFAGDRKAPTRFKYTDDDFNGASRFQDFSGDNMDQRSFTEFMRMVFSVARTKAAPGAIVATFIDWRNLPAITDALQAGGWVWRGVVIWDKKSSRPQKGRFRNQCEFVVWGSNGPLPVDRAVGCLPGLFSFANVPSQKRHHQTEKPIELLENLLKIVPAGSTVLDPFMGSGSTAVACIKTGRKFVGFELDKDYFQTAQRRICMAAFNAPPRNWRTRLRRYTMHMVNDKGEAVYYNLVRKNNKDYWLVQGIGSTVVYGRDRERRKSRHFTQEQQAERYIARHGFRAD